MNGNCLMTSFGLSTLPCGLSSVVHGHRSTPKTRVDRRSEPTCKLHRPLRYPSTPSSPLVSKALNIEEINHLFVPATLSE
ncbi:hypothetical protein BDZ97DRAFT_1826082 [Flammula alnicola]|nr:hypothetical protein BDZ97DRAFT_1832117 [Flammula alnicola]KAF8962058.1 hypothetical protein BDZ97DRAFT_1826082 [Flammula alnicola]